MSAPAQGVSSPSGITNLAQRRKDREAFVASHHQWLDNAAEMLCDLDAMASAKTIDREAMHAAIDCAHFAIASARTLVK